jgi:hypothetical protein
MSAPQRQAVTLQGDSPAEHRAYAKDKQNDCVQLFRSALSDPQGLSVEHVLRFCGDGFAALSPADNWREQVVPPLIKIYRLEMLLWAVQYPAVGAPDTLAQRLAQLAHGTSEHDYADEPLTLNLLRKARAAAYYANPNLISPQTFYRQSAAPGAQPGDLEPCVRRPTPEERALTDKYHTISLTTPEPFNRPPAADLLRPEDIEQHLLVEEVAIPVEYQRSLATIRITRAERMAATALPTPEQLFFTT